MALPASGTIDLLAIQTEFSASGLAASAVAGIPGTSLAGSDLQPDRSMLDFLGRSSYTPQFRVDSSSAFTDTTFTVPAGTPAGTTYYYVLVGGGGAGGYTLTGKTRASTGGGGGGAARDSITVVNTVGSSGGAGGSGRIIIYG
jgi:hypothetical protein